MSSGQILEQVSFYMINKAFFGKNNCLKITLNQQNECYFHFGLAGKDNQWAWKKIKFNDAELGLMLLVLKNQKKSVAFFHSFNGKKTQIWMNRDNEFVFLKIKEMSKSLTEGEQEVLKILIEQIIIKMNNEHSTKN